jgi:hypothetical protein
VDGCGLIRGSRQPSTARVAPGEQTEGPALLHQPRHEIRPHLRAKPKPSVLPPIPYCLVYTWRDDWDHFVITDIGVDEAVALPVAGEA